MDEHKRNILVVMADLALQWCRGGVESITIHADMCDDIPYERVTVWGPDPDADPLWEWSNFPEDTE